MRHSFYMAIIVAQRRVRFAGRCFRATDKVFSNVVCWRLLYPNRGRRHANYMDTIARDTQQEIEDSVNSISVVPEE